MLSVVTLLAQAGETEPNSGFGAFLLFVIICILIAIFNSGNKKRDYDIHMVGHAKQR